MYNEQCRPWFYYLLLAIVAISLIGALGLYFALVPREDGVATSLVFWLAFGFPIVTFIWMSWSASSYAIQYDGKFLSFGYLGWGVRLSNSEIISAKVVEIKWMKWGGIGWKIKPWNKIGYIVKSGPGIEMLTHLKGRTYTFNCNDPQSLMNDLHGAGITIENDSAV